MPCGSGARTEDSRLLQMAASAGSTQQAASAGHHQLHHQGRFHVSHATLAYHVEAAAAVVAAAAAAGTSHHQHVEAERAAAWDHQCQELHSAVGILDSLPWCRGGGRHHLVLGGPQAAVTAAAFHSMPELVEEAQLDFAAAEAAAEAAAAASSASAAASAAAAAESATEAGAAEAAEDVAEDGGCTLTAQLGKSISQVRMSASSSNFPSLECRCCCDDGDHSGPWEPRPPQPPAPSPAAAAAVANSGSTAASHLEPPWSNNSCCRSLSQRPTSPASLRQLAACHRSERVGPTITRSASFRRRTSAAGHQQQPHHQGVTSGGGGAADSCGPLLEEQQQHHVTYQEYLDQLRDRVQLWLLDTAAASCHGGAEEDEEEEKLEEGPADDGVYCCHDNWTPDD